MPVVQCQKRADVERWIMNTSSFFSNFSLGRSGLMPRRSSDRVSFTSAVHFIFLRSSGDLFLELQYANGLSASLCIIDLRPGGKKGHREHKHKKDLLGRV